MLNQQESNGDEEENVLNYNLRGGRIIADPLPGDEVVISGLSGNFPSSANVYEFREHLFNKVNMVTPNSRWDYKHPELPNSSGTVPGLNKYDSGYFGVHERQSQSLDAMATLMQERTVEAIFDAGMQPSDFEGTRTGVFIGACFSENEKLWYYNNLTTQTYAITGSERSMLAHRISYFLKLKGPSYTADTACSSSLFAMEHAYRGIRMGEIDYAIVGGVNLCLHPCTTIQFARLGILSPDGACKCFDAQGNGYARSEAAVCTILQKQKGAKRVYAKLVHVRSNSDGFKDQGITFPSAPAQLDLVTEFYDECEIDKFSLNFLETHGTGTPVGDPEECSSVDAFFARHRKHPLLIGSVKSNIGHSEAASGLCSVTKGIIAFESGYIPPNINFNTPREKIKGIVEGRMEVVVDKYPLGDDEALIGVNNFGFGGSNCHILLQRNAKEKMRKRYQKDDLPRLVCVSGRTAEAVETLLDAVSCNDFDAEFVGLLHEGFRKSVENHLYRGYTIVTGTGEITRSLKYSPIHSKPLIFAFGKLNNWCNIGYHLMALPIFSDYIEKLQRSLLSKKFNIYDILLNNKVPQRCDIQLLGSTVVLAGIINILNLLSIKPTGYFQHTFQELLCSYCKGLLTLEETIHCALIVNEAVNNNNNNNNEAWDKRNSKLIDYALDTLKTYLASSALKEQLIKNISNAVEDKKSVRDQFGGRKKWARHFVNSLNQSTLQSVPTVDLESLVFQIGTGRLDISKDLSVVSLFDKEEGNHLTEFMKSLGRLYEFGYNPQISKLYPTMDFPVSRGTRMVSPYIKWFHEREKCVPHYTMELTRQGELGVKRYRIHSSDYEWSYVTGHVINDRNLFPATGYLYLVWNTFALVNGMAMGDMEIVFENCRFVRATTLPEKADVVLEVAIHTGSGNFEIAEGDTVVVKGRISMLDCTRSSSTTEESDEALLSNGYFPLKTKDVYKELRLRGYNYEGAFRGIQEARADGSTAFIKWENNWVPFLDSMLQLNILQADSRLLYVPISILNMTISAKKHREFIHSKTVPGEENTVLPVYCDKPTGVIRSGGVTITGLLAKSIARRKDLGIPVLEEYKFVPNNTKLDTYDSVRVNIEIILENTLMTQVKAVELVDEFSSKTESPLMPLVELVLGDQPLVQPFLKILSKTPLDVSIEVEDKKLNKETDCLFVIASNVLKRPNILYEAFAVIKENGFIISRESFDFDESLLKNSEITILTVHKTPTETLVLLQKKAKLKQQNYVKITSTVDFSWISKLQDTIKNNCDLVLYAEKEPTSGVLGLLNCLRREPDTKHVRGVFLMDQVTQFQPTHSFFTDQLNKNMAVNVHKDNQWGTYRHLLLGEQKSVESEHCFVNTTVPGDLSSLRWIEGPLCQRTAVASESKLVYVYYSALNFRDIMTASGKLNIDAVSQNRLEQECVQGTEFSGRDTRGRRIMGMLSGGALSTLVLADSYLSAVVPDAWSLEEAVTVPVVYSTVIYALLTRGQLKAGETILIHSGSGGVGQAAIRLSLYCGCTVFTTVGTQEKRDFLKNTFPALEDHHIGNSHDESFEQMIYRETNGKGVDMVLNSLAEDKLIASVRCLAQGGRLMEIGKYDMANNNDLSLLLFQKEASFHGVMLDQFFKETPQKKIQVMELFLKMLNTGAMQPLSRTVFNYDKVEEAYRFMTTGKHMGKVLIKIREPEEQAVALVPRNKFTCLPRFSCNPDKVYVITGGLGGFGLELADWLVLRGARKIMLTSRKGITNGYQDLRIRLWKSYGTIVKISTAPIAAKLGCHQLIQESLELGPIDVIFNLAVVLEDSIFENQSPETFETSFAPKARSTVYLDELTREMCPELSQFVVFSSVSCGRGNAGQTNYGMANSVMERICEGRRQRGFPALAIEWGAVGEVGLVAEMLGDEKLEISGTLQQKISSCLQVLDSLLRQKDAAIVSSMVVAEKRGVNSADNIVDAVLNILGVTDVKSISLHSTLAELGMDSMSGVEIKQTLERDFDVFLTAKDIRTITLTRLKEIQEEKFGMGKDEELPEGKIGLEIVFRLIGDEAESTVPCIPLRSNIGKEEVGPKVLLFPGIEGFVKVFDALAARLKAHTIGLQFTYGNQELSIKEIAVSLMPSVERHISKTKPFNILAYSYGSLVALEVVHILESKGYTGTLICLDGAPKLVKGVFLQADVMSSEQQFQNNLAGRLLSTFVPAELISKRKETISKCTSWDERVSLIIELAESRLPHSTAYSRTICNVLYWRTKSLIDYNPSFAKLQSNIKLYKPKQVTVPHLEEDYGLSKLFTKPVEVKVFDGNHSTFVDDAALAEAVNADIQ